MGFFCLRVLRLASRREPGLCAGRAGGGALDWRPRRPTGVRRRGRRLDGGGGRGRAAGPGARGGGGSRGGGGRGGWMGVVAEAAGLAGARVVGVIPQALVDKEQANRLCDELHIVHTMHERKAMMAERSPAFVALPGGIGTLEELFEAWTWPQLGYHGKPLGLLNVAGYFDGLLGFLQTSVASGF